MADKPGDIEREIAERRREISAKIDRLSQRLGEDLRSARTEAGDRVPTSKVDSLLHEHPFTSVAFAFGLGAVLGGVSPSASAMGSAGSDMGRRGGHAAAGMAGAGGGLLSSLVEPLRQPIQDEVTQFVRQAAAGFGEDGRNGHRRGADNR